MVDIDTGILIDMIASREVADVANWLTEYPNIQIVSRDGSFNYAAAITEAHPEAIQISDRFHLVKNLNERATRVFHKLFKGRVMIPITGKTAEREIKLGSGKIADKIRIVKEMRSEGRSIDEIHGLTRILQKTIKKYLDMSEQDIPKKKPDSREQEHLDAVKRLQERVALVRSLKTQGMGIRPIARQTGLAPQTIRTYLSETFVLVNGQYGKYREGKLGPYREIVLRLKSEGLKYGEIHKAIRAKGYDGSQTALRTFIAKERRIRNEAQSQYGNNPVELLDKTWIIKLLYHPIEKVNGITKEQFSAVIKAYPLAGKIFELVESFKKIIMGTNPRELDQWINSALSMNNDEINRFINGIQRDLTAVKNGIRYCYNNGVAEGNVNKVKVIKRIMYGRCGFDLLRNKVLKNEFILKFN